MKRHPFTSLFALLLAVAVSARAADHIEIETRFFEIAASAAAKSKLLGKPSPEARVRGVLAENAWHTELHDLMHLRGLDLLSAPRVTTKSGQRAKIEIIREFRYPTRLTPDQKRLGEFIASDYTTRNVGVTVDLTPRFAKSGEISLDLHPQLTELLGFQSVTTGKFLSAETLEAPLGERVLTPGNLPEKGWQPVFATRSVKTKVTLAPGSTVLLGGLRRELPKGARKPKVERLIFIAVTARTAR